MKPIVPTTVLLVASLSASVAAQDTPSHLQDLVGARAAGGETQLESRGYEFIKSQKGTDRIWANWWNPSNQQCLSVVTYDGRYDSIVVAPKLDCDQGGGSSGRHPHDFSDLVGARASAVDSRMERDGFKQVDLFKGADLAKSWWFSPRTAECVVIDVVDGKVDKVGRAPGYPACKN